MVVRAGLDATKSSEIERNRARLQGGGSPPAGPQTRRPSPPFSAPNPSPFPYSHLPTLPLTPLRPGPGPRRRPPKAREPEGGGGGGGWRPEGAPAEGAADERRSGWVRRGGLSSTAVGSGVAAGPPDGWWGGSPVDWDLCPFLCTKLSRLRARSQGLERRRPASRCQRSRRVCARQLELEAGARRLRVRPECRLPLFGVVSEALLRSGSAGSASRSPGSVASVGDG